MDILYLVDRLENLIASSRRMPLVGQIMVKEADILNLVDQLRTTIPDEIKQARRIIQDKERLLAQAQAEANALLTRAREESERAVNREGLLKAAEARSRELVLQAEEEAEQLKKDADTYVIETLHALRDHLNSIETDIDRSILSIEKGLATLEGGPADEEGDEMGDDEGAYEEDEQDREQNRVQQPVRRRASSLAADTMGGPIHLPADDAWAVDDEEYPSAPHHDIPPRARRRYEEN